MKIYNKLVRDKIPQIIESKNQTCDIKILSDDEYLFELNKKLKEEVQEYLQSGEVEELADIEEVIRAILNTKDCTYEKFEELRLKKVEKRGSFNEKIFLLSADEDN